MLRKNFEGRKLKRREEARERQAASDIRKERGKIEDAKREELRRDLDK